MYIQEPFDLRRVLHAVDRVEADRDELIAHLTANLDSDAGSSLFDALEAWITVKIDELHASPFVPVEDRDKTWQWYKEFLPAIYLSAIQLIWTNPELRDRFTGVLPTPYGEDADKSPASQISYLIQGAAESWPVSSAMRSMLVATESAKD